jgi:hypothetical protein
MNVLGFSILLIDIKELSSQSSLLWLYPSLLVVCITCDF